MIFKKVQKKKGSFESQSFKEMKWHKINLKLCISSYVTSELDY